MRPLPLTLLVWFALAALCNGAIADAPTVLTTDSARSSGARIDHHTAESTALAQVPGGRLHADVEEVGPAASKIARTVRG